MKKEKLQENSYRVMICYKQIGYIDVEAVDEDEAIDIAKDDVFGGEIKYVNEWMEVGWSGGDGIGVRLRS